MTTKATFAELKASLDRQGVSLVAVSKSKSPEEIMSVYHQGQRIFGENRVQELREKHPALPADIEWHMIGHLQSNKVKYITSFVSMIHSIDSIKLLNRVDREAAQAGRVIDVLLQVKIGLEETKFGFDPEELMTRGPELVSPARRHVRIRGLMGMASFVADEAQVRTEFRRLKELFDRSSVAFYDGNADFDTISMGMSGDYPIAIAEGSTMVRIGSLIFGARD